MDVTVLSEHDSDNSIVEVEIPKKASPVLVQIDEDDIHLNLSEKDTSKLTMEPSSETEQDKPDIIISDDSHNFKEPELLHRRIDINRIISPGHWTPDMIRFYNEDWGNELNFTVENLQRQMDKRQYLWQISQRDRAFVYQSNKDFPHCRNCGQPGHVIATCSEPPYVPKCHMCGILGHTSFQCPNAICLSCGNKTRNYHVGCNKCQFRNGRICSRCSMRGHCLVECPDHWRLYHSTLTTGDVVVPPGNIYKNEEEIWCCNCGVKGHYHCFCTEPKIKDGYCQTVPYVVSYEREFYNQLRPQEEINCKLTNKQLNKLRRASNLLCLKQLKGPRDLSKPKKKLSQKAIENFKNNWGRKLKKAWMKKRLKKKKEKKNDKESQI